jgi:hypothetical protein
MCRRVSDAGLGNLAPLKNLPFVNVMRTRVSIRGLERLREASPDVLNSQ